MLLCFPSFSLPHLDYTLEGKYNIFTTQRVDLPNSTCIDSGLGYIIKGNLNSLNTTLTKLDNSLIRGVSIEFTYDTTILTDIVNRLSITKVDTQDIGDIQFVYGYSPMLPLFTTIDNQKINIQIAKEKDYLKIGYPLILDGA